MCSTRQGIIDYLERHSEGATFTDLIAQVKSQYGAEEFAALLNNLVRHKQLVLASDRYYLSDISLDRVERFREKQTQQADREADVLYLRALAENYKHVAENLVIIADRMAQGGGE